MGKQQYCRKYLDVLYHEQTPFTLIEILHSLMMEDRNPSNRLTFVMGYPPTLHEWEQGLKGYVGLCSLEPYIPLVYPQSNSTEGDYLATNHILRIYKHHNRKPILIYDVTKAEDTKDNYGI